LFIAASEAQVPSPSARYFRYLPRRYFDDGSILAKLNPGDLVNDYRGLSGLGERLIRMGEAMIAAHQK
jgi:hypothetical protein